MKAKDITPGLAVYWYGPNGKRKYDRNRENPDDCRWTTDGRLYGKRDLYGAFTESRPGNRVRGTHVKLTRPKPEGSPPYVTTEAYVPLGQVLGPYDDIAPARRELVAKARDEADRAKKLLRQAHLAQEEVAKRAAALGYEVRTPCRADEIHIAVDVLARLLAELEAARDQLTRQAA